MGIVELGGTRVAYRVDGEGPGLVFVHGTGGNAETNWGHLVPDLARDWTVVRPDYSGSGDTCDKGGELSVERLAGEVVAAAEAAGAVPFDLVGFSLGAAVATKIAADYSHLVRRVVLLGAFLDGANPRQRMQFGLWNDLIRGDRHAMARFVLLTGFSPTFLASLGHDGIKQAVETIVSGNDWEGMARQVDLDLTIDVAEAARRIEKPVLVIGATHDHMVPPDEARTVAAMIPDARYTEMPTGHLAALELPDAFIALLRDFLLSDLRS
ncbi:alpha/beta fold hydrolase [Oryzibacter oryziterrae]|uniref:alpha/beta fold hydrolase n=1 Tax=Oryzibacter oryziterrae TaxID=2766474 RepID=UPI001F25A79D|nr:alpha/beta hydrolase [Oryzibacter oryziterrae]